MTAAEPFPGSVNLKGAVALTAKLIRFVYLGKIYIQEPCAHPLWRRIRKGRIVEKRKLRSKFKCEALFIVRYSNDGLLGCSALNVLQGHPSVIA